MKHNATVEVIQVTPEMATEWLSDRWDGQRNLRRDHVDRLSSDMVSGRFKLGPDAIVRVKGKLANGQHRLSAVIESGKAQSFLVMDSKDEELFKVIDSGLRRKPSDSLIGIPYAKHIPSIARWVMAYNSGRVVGAYSSAASVGRNCGVSQTELIDYCINNLSILEEAAGFVSPLNAQTKLLSVSIAGALYVICSTKDTLLVKVKSFLHQVFIDGGMTAAGDFRNRLISNKGSKARLPSGYIFALTLKAFSIFSKGQRQVSLRWKSDEGFPDIE